MTIIIGKRSGNAIVNVNTNLPTITDWVDYTPGVSGVTVSSQVGAWRRVGTEMQIRGKIVYSATPTAGVYISIPSGYTLDTSKIPGDAGNIFVFGNATFLDTSANYGYVGSVYFNSSTIFGFYSESAVSAWDGNSPIASPESGDSISFELSLPISEWADTGITSQTDVSAYIPPASDSEAGIVTADAQTFGGVKTFNDAPVISDSSSISGVVHTTGNETVAGVKTFSNTTESSSKDNGAIVVEGGVGIEKSVNIGGDVNITGTLSAQNADHINAGLLSYTYTNTGTTLATSVITWEDAANKPTGTITIKWNYRRIIDLVFIDFDIVYETAATAAQEWVYFTWPTGWPALAGYGSDGSNAQVMGSGGLAQVTTSSYISSKGLFVDDSARVWVSNDPLTSVRCVHGSFVYITSA